MKAHVQATEARRAGAPKVEVLALSPERQAAVDAMLPRAQQALDAHFESGAGFPGISLYWPALGIPPRREIGPGGALSAFDNGTLTKDCASILLLNGEALKRGERGALQRFMQPEMKILDLSADEKKYGVPATNWESVWVPPAADRAKLGGRSVALRESGYVQSNEDGLGLNFDGTSKQHNESVRRVELAPELMALVDAVERAVAKVPGVEFQGMTFSSGSQQWRVELRAPGFSDKVAAAL